MTSEEETDELAGALAHYKAAEQLREKDLEHRLDRERLLGGLLPVSDALFELEQYLADPARTSAPTTAALSDLRHRIDVIHRMLLRVLKNEAVEPMTSVGTAFDVSRHFSIGVEVAPSAPDDIVLRETQRGFLWNDRVLRQAKVIVGQSDTRPGEKQQP